jgi:hypothetical protein
MYTGAHHAAHDATPRVLTTRDVIAAYAAAGIGAWLLLLAILIGVVI